MARSRPAKIAEPRHREPLAEISTHGNNNVDLDYNDDDPIDLDHPSDHYNRYDDDDDDNEDDDELPSSHLSSQKRPHGGRDFPAKRVRLSKPKVSQYSID